MATSDRKALEELKARFDELLRRVEALEGGTVQRPSAAEQAGTTSPDSTQSA